ncbi:hypothetical protein evm_002985 [Chilo suppressalis]|nr:hypothetical protein evm_002985 [Chilo suppressalis]
MFQSHAVGGVGVGVGSVGSVLVNGAAAAAGLGALALSLSLAPPGTAPPAPLTPHTLDHIKVCTRRTLALSLSLAPPGTAPPAPLTPHTLDHIKVCTRRTLALSLSLAPPGTAPPAPLTPHTLDHIKVALRQAGYSEAGVGEISAALSLLVKHGVLGLALPTALPAPLSAAYFPMPHAHAHAQDPPAVFGPIGQVGLGGARGGSLERFAEVAFEALRPPAVAPISLSGGVGGVGGVFPASASLLPLSKSPTPADAGAKDSKNVEIAEVSSWEQEVQPARRGAKGPRKNVRFAEVIVGAILGECPTLTSLLPLSKSPTPADAGAKDSKKRGDRRGHRGRLYWVECPTPHLGNAAMLKQSPTPADAGAKDSKNVEIAEVIVGAILGPGGRSLVEIQQMSGANIQISKKGTFAPGTRNRIVTISGSNTAISNAHYLIEQKIQEEELKRTRHNAISGLMQ